MGDSKKTLVTGTGRAGTSFLMHLLTDLGFNTGYSKKEIFGELNKYEGLNAGIEHPINSGRWINADIVKSPEYAKIDKLEEILKTNEVLDVIIPIRNLTATSKSRENCNTNHGRYGGFWLGAETIEEQETANAKLIYNLIEYLTEKDIPFTTIAFPRMANDCRYLYNKLKSVDSLSSNKRNYSINNYQPFKDSFEVIANPDKINF